MKSLALWSCNHVGSWRADSFNTSNGKPTKAVALSFWGREEATAGEADVAHGAHVVDAFPFSVTSETPPQLRTRPSRTYK